MKKLPLLPLRDIVVFPHMMVPLYVGRASSIQAVNAAVAHDGEILLCAQKEARTNSPKPGEIYEIGTVGNVMQHIKRPDGTVKILVEGVRRARIVNYVENSDFFAVEFEALEVPEMPAEDILGLIRDTREAFDVYAGLSKRLQPDVLASIKAIESADRLSDTIVAHLAVKHSDKQALLETVSARARLERLLELMQSETEILTVEKKIRSRVKRQMERSEKEYYLNEQMRAIQKELGEREDLKSEVAELEEQIQTVKMPVESRERVAKELKKLKMMAPMSAEATVVRNYIDWCLELPWETYAEEHLDLELAENVLDEDHYGLKKPKERILEFLAVHKLVERLRGPILCFVGPPGVGKTSLAKSIARATGRDFVRMSLGGVRDEAEIRGHRRTYIGAMPGKVIQGIKKAGSSNPVFLLDEIDKISADFRGDPASALLEVLDPHQNNTFNDHYLDLDYDLSKVMFICTANDTHGLPHALKDRMEIIRIAGYTELEKTAIGSKYLVPRQQAENGLKDVVLEWSEASTRSIIQYYTREAGVRTLEREIGAVCRKIARGVVAGEIKGPKYRVTTSRIRKFLGVEKFRSSRREDHPQIGTSTGLAWTSVGGDILQIEVGMMPGRGKLMITGKLGEVMQESAQAAMSYVRSRSKSWGLQPNFYQAIDIHVHVPEGAMPKDGPSAGITICTALVSALSGIAVRNDIAMTGEVTLRGNVLPIGGLKEKAMAAHRAEIFEIIVPKDNEKDIEDIPKEIKEVMSFHVVEHVDEVLRRALVLADPESFYERTAGMATFELDEMIDLASRERTMNRSDDGNPHPSEGTRIVQ
ncbi:MAG: endopeptidase La [Myxococcota bacterium]|nr:endopeptidase La [Myxococcota bacterium]